MEKADIWMPLFIGDYLADTARLTTEQHGAYLLLIMDYWRNGPPPDDAQVLCQITRLSIDAWSNAQAMLRRFFTVGDGVWRHKRIDKEIQSAGTKKGKAIDKAKTAAAARWAKVGTEKQYKLNATSNTSSIAQGMLEPCPSPSPSPLDKPKSNALSSSPSANIDHAKLEKQKTNKQVNDAARDVLAYLNKNAGKNFRDVDSTLGPIVARLKEGYTAERLREIAFYKIEQWGTDEKMAEYLRPATLYNATKCAQYDGELGS